MRLFFAVLLPEDVLAVLQRSQDELRHTICAGGISWVRPHQFHYTLKFLGDTTPARARVAVEAAEAIQEKLAPFQVTLGGLGAFPNAERPSVLWVGASAGGPRLSHVAYLLDEQLGRVGFSKEKRPFTAHLTVARIKTYEGEAAAARLLRTARWGDLAAARIDRFVLMRSTLRPTGAEYTVVDEFLFQGEGSDREDDPHGA
ncbi:MAG: RNA 2',3'-cyclic phosphodiesterase [Chthonomonadales bacterium]